jgi:hypothetical protein
MALRLGAENSLSWVFAVRALSPLQKQIPILEQWLWGGMLFYPHQMRNLTLRRAICLHFLTAGRFNPNDGCKMDASTESCSTHLATTHLAGEEGLRTRSTLISLTAPADQSVHLLWTAQPRGIHGETQPFPADHELALRIRWASISSPLLSQPSIQQSGPSSPAFH